MTETNDDYGLSIGAVMAARKQYDDVCASQGADSQEAEQARDRLTRTIEHRDEMRKHHDAAPDAGRWDK